MYYKVSFYSKNGLLIIFIGVVAVGGVSMSCLTYSLDLWYILEVTTMLERRT